MYSAPKSARPSLDHPDCRRVGGYYVSNKENGTYRIQIAGYASKKSTPATYHPADYCRVYRPATEGNLTLHTNKSDSLLAAASANRGHRCDLCLADLIPRTPPPTPAPPPPCRQPCGHNNGRSQHDRWKESTVERIPALVTQKKKHKHTQVN